MQNKSFDKSSFMIKKKGIEQTTMDALESWEMPNGLRSFRSQWKPLSGRILIPYQHLIPCMTEVSKSIIFVIVYSLVIAVLSISDYYWTISFN